MGKVGFMCLYVSKFPKETLKLIGFLLGHLEK